MTNFSQLITFTLHGLKHINPPKLTQPKLVENQRLTASMQLRDVGIACVIFSGQQYF